jgi:Protein of unknown function (DUF1573)
MKTRILTLTLSILLSVSMRADLKWEQTTADLHPAAGDKTAVAHFKYENTGKTPVHFKSVRASCGCTVAQSQKEVVNPGEKGEITATFTIGDRTGLQEKTVTVQTDDPDPKNATIQLLLKANIATALDIKPAFLYWKSGEVPQPKKISVKASKDFPAKNISVISNSQVFTSKVEPAGPGEWTIEVQPKDTSHPVGTSLLIQTDYPKEAPKNFYVMVQVTNPPGQIRPANIPGAASPPAIPKPSSAGGIQQ